MDLKLTERVLQALGAGRPLLHHLNADSSWLLQLPLPRAKHEPGEKAWFNILIDPWLSGTQSDVASWFSTQRHAVECAVPSIAAVETLLHEVENISRTEKKADNETASSTTRGNSEIGTEPSLIDLIAVSHEFTDHCHKETLLECSASTPVIAPRKAASLIRGWRHFRTVQETPAFPPSGSKDWRDLWCPSLPPWLRIARLTSPRDIQYFHSALIFLFNNGSDDGAESAEAILYTPHGYLARDLKCMAGLSPSVRTLAFLHGLHNVTMPGKQINYGAFNGLEAQKILKARYWVGTHDEVKIPAGLIKYVLRRKAYSIQDVLVHARAKRNLKSGSVESGKSEVTDAIPYIDLENGQTLVLR